MNQDFTIRKGRPSDVPLFRDRLIEMWVEHAQKEPGLLSAEAMKKVDVEGWYKDAFDSENTVVFAAEVDGKFAGVLRADIEEIPRFFEHNKVFFLDSGYVMPEYRGRGIIRALIQEVEKAAREKGIKRLQGRVYTYNKSMQKVMEACGYHMPHSTWDKVLK